ncbi:A24 family peptidase [Pseudarthrobacter sp. BIM B-2242]|uniref:prepilin peptidase n=1 Tax=Pseudarthrobacter sp. BIM B-2242 TaxID=2772401 RepID=UPI00168BEEB6|nr:A24 family peptidase [Pseudarthrobacter sp. BIM B-2242]QOD05894.1 hypothetical protein IDT60_20200 [Pseudarthrobacter sp. BIM B-2242]
MKKTLIARAGAATAVVVALLFGAMAPAQAASVPAAATTVSAAATGTVPAYKPAREIGDDSSRPAGASGSCGTSSSSASQSAMLPVARWADATARMHSRIDAGPIGINAELIQRNALQNGGMATGNFMWTTGAGLSSFAINFCLLDSAGGAADQIGATIANTIKDPRNGLLAGLVVIGVFGLLFAGYRRGNMMWKPIMMKAVIVGLFFVMAMGATGSTGGGTVGADGRVDNGPYRPGVGSPGWVVTKVNNVVASLASAPATALAVDPGTAAGPSGDPLACVNYTASLKKEYTNTYGGGAGAMASSVPLILSSIWETTGLKAWRTAQFGSAAEGTMSDHAWCHLLEQNAKVPIGTSAASAGSVQMIMNRVFNGSGVPAPAAGSDFYKSTAFSTPDNVTQDKSIVAWAACRIKDGATNLNDGNSWTTDAFNSGIADGTKPSGEDCRKVFMTKQDSADAFDWSSNGDEVNKRTDTDDPAAGQELRTFIRTLHGNDIVGGMTSILAYNISALGMLIVFGLIGLAIIVSKVALVVMIIIAFFLMLQALLPGADMSKLGGFLKTLVGVNLFVFAIQLVFAFVTVFTKMLQTVGEGMLGGDTSLIAMLWSGLAPLVAVAILHMMFTKVMKVPSPFSLSGGLAWGNAMSAAAGGAAFAGVSGLLDRSQSRLRNRASGAVKGSGKAALNTAMSRVSGGRVGAAAAAAGRRNAAVPSADAAAKGVLAGAAIEAAGRRPKHAAEAMKGTAGEGQETAAEGIPEGIPAGSGAEGAGAGAAAGRLDHTLLSTSRVRNSDLHKGKMSAPEREMLKDAAHEERWAAAEWKKQQDEEMGLGKRKGLKAQVADSWGNAKDQFAASPVSFAKGAAKKTVGTAALGAGLLVAGTATAGVVPALYGGYKVASAMRQNRVNKREKLDEITMDYRQMMEKTKRDKGESNQNRKGNQNTGAETLTNGTGEAAKAAADSVAGAPVSDARPEKPTVTSPLPVVPSVSRVQQDVPAAQVPDAPSAARPLAPASGRPERASR